MGRLIAFILGGAAIAFYGTYMLPVGELRSNIVGIWEGVLDADLLRSIKDHGAGAVAGIGLILFAARGSRE